MKLILSFALLAIGVAVPGNAQNASSKAANRPALEQQLRERTAGVLQTRLGLSASQMDRLEQTNRKFAPQLARLASQERDTRRQLRNEMQSAAPNQQLVNDLLNTSLQLQHQRLDVVDAEQKELSGFLTPVQRAGYLAFQIQLRRRADQLANQNGGRAQRLGRRPGTKLPQ